MPDVGHAWDHQHAHCHLRATVCLNKNKHTCTQHKTRLVSLHHHHPLSSIHTHASLPFPCSLNLHSGVDGGAVLGPMHDMVALLATLTDAHGKATIPGFYDGVLPVSEEERAIYQQVNLDTDRYKWVDGGRGARDAALGADNMPFAQGRNWCQQPELVVAPGCAHGALARADAHCQLHHLEQHSQLLFCHSA